MTPDRPAWWPAGLWPGSRDRRTPPGGLPDRPRAGDGGRPSPGDSFLEALVAAFGATGASVYRLDRERSAWAVERRVGEDPDGSSVELAAAGHPLTWCLREGLVMQAETSELVGGRSAGWALAGVAPASDRALVVTFRGSPPTGARQGMDAALQHLSALCDAGVV